ncbi:MAG: hypothetical protein AAFV74_23795, partial [Pseudomonadota bacterium]
MTKLLFAQQDRIIVVTGLSRGRPMIPQGEDASFTRRPGRMLRLSILERGFHESSTDRRAVQLRTGFKV